MIAISSGSWPIRMTSSTSADKTSNATVSVMKNLASALSSSTTALNENIRLRPAAGFIRLNFGAREPAAKSQPPREIGPIIAASTKEIMIG
ncbi:hypothetical protein D3C84_973850 [compost metagenome]